MNLTQEQTDKILQKLEDNDFFVTCKPNDEVIDEDYFNEKVNEALEEK